jgi:hypothetical protein
MMASTSKAEKGKGKDKNNSKSSKDDLLCTNTNCGRRGHTIDQCWEKGGKKEGQAPEWWKKSSKGKKASANVAENKTAEGNEPDNFAMLTTTIPYESRPH